MRFNKKSVNNGNNWISLKHKIVECFIKGLTYLN
jgi:hypothetical protein